MGAFCNGHRMLHHRQSNYLIVIGLGLILLSLGGCGPAEDISAYLHYSSYRLTIEVVGEGTVRPEEGSHYYDQGAVVNVLASPAEGWKFREWDGAVANRYLEETTIIMEDHRVLRAIFIEDDSYIDPSPYQRWRPNLQPLHLDL